MYKICYFLCFTTFCAYLNGMSPRLPGNLPTELWINIFIHYVSWQSQLNLMRTCCNLRHLYETDKRVYFDHGIVANFKNYAYQDCTGMKVLCTKIATGKLRGSITLAAFSDQQCLHFINSFPATYKHITHLTFDSRCLDCAHIYELRDTFTQCPNKPLKALTVHNSNIGKQTLDSLLTFFTFLEELDLSHNNNLCLEYYHNEQHNLRRRKSHPADINGALAMILQEFEKLKKLSINNCKLTDEHIISFPGLLQKNTYLEELSLAGNQLTAKMCIRLKDANKESEKPLLLNLDGQKKE